MKQTILAVLAAFIFNAFAASDDFALVTCDVKTLADAQKCMDREAKKQTRYEEENEGYASARVDMLAGVIRVLGFKEDVVEKAKAADFAGAVAVYNDEMHIVYYAINKGENVRPEILTDMNIVDLQYDLEGHRLPPAALFALGNDDLLKSNAMDDVREHLQYIADERKENGQEGNDPVNVEPAPKYNTLKCWDTYKKKGSVPLFVATILRQNELNVKEFNAGDEYPHLQAPVAEILGTEITSSHSKYKGNQEFDFAGSRLILPLSLDKDDLIQAYKTGIGMGPKENGVIIGDLEEDGDGAGSHFSVRLSCRSYAN